MKTLSKKAKYALRALYYLTPHHGGGPVLISSISAAEKIPHKFLELILLQLRGKGLVESKKGKGGGYYLAKPPDQVTIGEVIRIIDGPLAPLPCASETAYRRCDECVDEKRCGTRMVMRQVRDAMAAILDHTTLADVHDKVKATEGEPDHSLMYYI
ncbi:MAG TPA: Rrf2 family transcriptional regulator [Bryobacteraceae bacterium]|nr:Rrf2 family transcriptional regulator [Bryobacteraceae bacterium]